MPTVIKETTVYEVDTKQEAIDFIKDKLDESNGNVNIKQKEKEKKMQGEVVASWHEITVENSYPYNMKKNNI